MSMKDILLFGIQCSGKGTQAKIIRNNHADMFSYFSSGDHFRAITSTDNAIGNYINNRIKNGQLIDDNVTISLFMTYMYTVLDEKKSMLLDGYPRTPSQMEHFLNICKEHNRSLLGLHFVIPDEIVFERMKERNRNDDTPEVMKKRIEQFYTKTMPMIELFEKNSSLIKIDATQSIEEIAKEVALHIQQ